MSRIAASITSMVFVFLLGSAAVRAQPAESTSYSTGQPLPAPNAMPAGDAQPAPDQDGPPPPIPPFVDVPPVQAQGGGFCFEGAHPVDSQVVPGVTWDATTGRHVHPYPPFDLRLFSVQNGCYYFIGDPTDFGYAGETYSYYGAHPILGAYGGGWCFMIGPHRHFWRPWSPMFVTVGPWFYWEGPYDPFFWTYWPYYHYYYRAHYPHYYAHGAFFRGHAVAPRISSVPRPMHAGPAWHGAGPRGIAGPGAGPYPAGPVGPRGISAPPSGGFRAAPNISPGGGFRAAPNVAPSGGVRAAPMMAPRAAPSGGFAPRTFSAPRAAPSGGGMHFGHGRR